MKNRITAAFLALFLGWFGIHRFYLNQPGYGVFYIILMFFFGVSFILGLIDALFFFLMSDEQFDLKYNRDPYPSNVRDRHKVNPRDYRSKSRTSRLRKPILRRNPHKKEGIEKFRDFDYLGAIVSFNKGLEISPTDPALHFNIACAYSLVEQKKLAFEHLEMAVAYGFKDFEKIKTHDALAFLRVQPEFERFVADDYRLEYVDNIKRDADVSKANPANENNNNIEAPKQDILQDDLLLSQIKRLQELKERGLISEREYLEEKAKIERT